jgi:hypothetical protein
VRARAVGRVEQGHIMSYIGKGGQVQSGARPTGGGGLTSGQKGLFALAAVLVGPSLLKTLYEKPKEAVDLSSYNIVTRYDTPGAPPHGLSTAHLLGASLPIGLRAGPALSWQRSSAWTPRCGLSSASRDRQGGSSAGAHRNCRRRARPSALQPSPLH